MVSIFYQIFSNNKANYHRIHYLCYLNYEALGNYIFVDTYITGVYKKITRTYKATNKRLHILKDLLTICESSEW